MIIKKTKLPGVLIFQPDIMEDTRGYFKELYHQEKLKKNIELNFVQDNLSISKKNVLRGLHYQNKKPQGKLVTCLSGSVFDVAVDINPKSKTFKQHVSIELSGENNNQIWIPPGFAHGFCVLSNEAKIFYKCTEIYYPEDQSGIIWNDEDISISWPIKNPILSDKDKNLNTLKKQLFSFE